MLKTRPKPQKTRLERLTFGFVLSVFSIFANAQQSGVPGSVAIDTENVESIRRYGVEIIVFEFADRNSAGTEVFTPDPLPEALPEDLFFSDSTEAINVGDPEFLGVDALGENIQTDFSGDNPVQPKPVIDYEGVPLVEIQTHEQTGLRVLTPDEYVLDDVYAHLRRLDAYRPLLRTAWVQSTLEKADTVPIRLRRLGNPPLRLDGTLTLYLSRFLHLVVDLSLEEKSPIRVPVEDNRTRQYGDRPSLQFDRDQVTPTVTYRIEEDRIVRNGELRYYDHPRFGVIAKIWRFEEESVEDSDSEMLINR